MRNALLLFLIGLLALSVALCGCPKGDDAGGGAGPAPTKAGPAPTKAGGETPKPDTSGWVDYTCDEHGFRCQFPTKPYAEDPQAQQMDAGSMTSYAYRCEMENGNIAYGVQVIEVEDSMAEKIGKPEFLESQKDAIAKGFEGATVAKDEKTEAYGTTVYELELDVPKSAELPADLVYRARMFTVGTRWFQVIATHVKDLDKPEDAKKFFDSFELIADEGPESGSESGESPAVGLADEAGEG